MTISSDETVGLLGGRYRLGQQLGRGAMAEVVAAHDTRLDRPVAVKRMRPALARDPEAVGRFEHEARASAGLSHPNVVAVFDTGEDEQGLPFLVMERLPGLTLADRMAAGPVPESEVLQVAGDVLAALTAAEQIGLVHRDIKPANILMTHDGCAKVADFGIAKATEATGDATATGLLVGTPAYLAPERIEGHPATNRSDLYSLGVILYEALSGRRAFAPGTAAAVATAALTDGVPRLASHEASASTANAVAVATARDPGQRFASAAAMAQALGLAPAAGDAISAISSAAAVSGIGTREPDETTVLDAVPLAPVSAVAPAGAVLAARRARLGLHGGRLAAAVAAVAVLLLGMASWALGGEGGEAVTTTTVPAVQVTVPPTVVTSTPDAEPAKGKGHGRKDRDDDHDD